MSRRLVSAAALLFAPLVPLTLNAQITIAGISISDIRTATRVIKTARDVADAHTIITASGSARKRARAAAHMSRWERETSAAFLAAYSRAVRGASSYPADPADVARLLELFVLEKALYEVRYEIGSRPEWVRIPIAGLLEHMQSTVATQ